MTNKPPLIAVREALEKALAALEDSITYSCQDFSLSPDSKQNSDCTAHNIATEECRQALAQLDEFIAGVPKLTFNPIYATKEEPPLVVDFNIFNRKFLCRSVSVENYAAHRKAAKLLHQGVYGGGDESNT